MEEGQRKLFHFDDVFSPFTLAYFPRPLQRARCLIEAPYSPSSSEGQSVGRPDRPFVIQIGSVSAYAERQDKWLTCCVREAGIHATLPRGFLSRSGLRVLPFPPARRSLDFSLHYNGESERARGMQGRGYSDKKFDPHRIFHRVSISSPRLSIGICTTKWLSVMTMKPPMTPEMELDCGES